jgi:hypothetical protein
MIRTLLVVAGVLCFEGGVMLLYLPSTFFDDSWVNSLHWGATLAFGGLGLLQARDLLRALMA